MPADSTSARAAALASPETISAGVSHSEPRSQLRDRIDPDAPSARRRSATIRSTPERAKCRRPPQARQARKPRASPPAAVALHEAKSARMASTTARSSSTTTILVPESACEEVAGRGATDACRLSARVARGTVIEKREPRPGAESDLDRGPRSPARPRTIARPSPMPRPLAWWRGTPRELNELVEHARAIRCGDADAGIDHVDAHRIRASARARRRHRPCACSERRSRRNCA